jgi:hypothetical protein
MQYNHLANPGSHAGTKCVLSSPQTSRLPLKGVDGHVYLWRVSNGTHLPRLSHNPLSSTFSSRGRKIRCDGAKPVCFHCCQRGGSEQCSYDPLPKRRGPDRVQGARTRGPKPKEGDGQRRRRRRRATPAVDQEATPPQEAGSSYGIERPSAAVDPSALDTHGDPVPDVHQQSAAALNRSLEVNVFQALESGVQLSSAACHDQTLTRDPTPSQSRNLVSGSRIVVVTSVVFMNH